MCVTSLYLPAVSRHSSVTDLAYNLLQALCPEVSLVMLPRISAVNMGLPGYKHPLCCHRIQ